MMTEVTTALSAVQLRLSTLEQKVIGQNVTTSSSTAPRPTGATRPRRRFNRIHAGRGAAGAWGRSPRLSPHSARAGRSYGRDRGDGARPPRSSIMRSAVEKLAAPRSTGMRRRLTITARPPWPQRSRWDRIRRLRRRSPRGAGGDVCGAGACGGRDDGRRGDAGGGGGGRGRAPRAEPVARDERAKAMFPMLAAKLWKAVAIALLIAAALGYRALLLHQRDAPRAAAAHLSASLADAEASNAALQSAIATQNSAVAQLRAELEQGVRAARPLLSARGDGGGNGGDAHGGERRARRLRARGSTAGCAAAIRWGNARAAELGRW